MFVAPEKGQGHAWGWTEIRYVANVRVHCTSVKSKLVRVHECSVQELKVKAE